MFSYVAESSGLIFAKLKKSWAFVVICLTRISVVNIRLVYLKQSNPFYLDTRIDIDNILDELLDLTEYIDQKIPIFVE